MKKIINDLDYQCPNCNSFNTRIKDSYHNCKDCDCSWECIREKEQQIKEKRTNGEIIRNINKLLGFDKYVEKIKWSNANKKEMLRLEGAIKELKECVKEEVAE